MFANEHDYFRFPPPPQNFVISPDALGITTVTDLSQQDMEKVRSVALLELTIMFDDHDIPLRSRRPAKAKSYPGKESVRDHHSYKLCSA